MRNISLFLLSLFVFPAVALADHHGRGKEQLNGFPGIYTIERPQATVTFTHDNYVIFVVNSTKVVSAIMNYEIGDGVMTLQDISPPAFFPDVVQECMRASAAKYAMIDIENGFSLSLVDEPCPPRARFLDGVTFIDYQKPNAGENE